MNLEELHSAYILCDGEMHSFKVNFDYVSTDKSKQTNARINLRVRKKEAKNKFERCIIEIAFEEITEISLFEDFKSSRDYSDITFKRLDTGAFYFSVDPFGNTNEPHEKDNFVIIA